MKRLFSVFFAILIVFSVVPLASCSRKSGLDHSLLEGTYNKDLAGTTLKVYNWGEYISDGKQGSIDVNKAFEEVTGIKVEYSFYDDNESMYSTLESGASYYDIIIPSDYMIQRLIANDMLKKVDVESLSNYKYISDDYKNLYFDPDNDYSVPYNVGMVGLIYNTTMVKESPTSWATLWDSDLKGNILMFKNPRDAFAIAQFRLGYDLNTTDKAHWDACADLLVEQNKLVQAYVMDQVFNKMEAGNAAVAPYYAGDFLSMKENNPDLAFVYPEEGVNIFCDSICIPKSTQNYEAALLYMNFMMEPAIALANAEYICYASPNTAVINNEDYIYYKNEILYPAKEDMPKVQWFHNLDEDIIKYYSELWTKVKVS